MTEPLRALQAKLGYEFQDASLANAALIHRSTGTPGNERLEFLGDAVIDLVIGEALYLRRPELREGDLTRMRASLVNREALAALARELELGADVVLGAPERRSGAFQRSSILEDVLEALVGAVFLDGGYAAARTVVLRLFARRLHALPDPESLKDAKTRLQEKLQARGLALPAYALAQASGPEHARRFRMECRVAELGIVGSGTGASRRKAEQRAAADALGQVPW